MASVYPGSLDSFSAVPSTLAGPPTHEELHEELVNAMVAVQAELGTDPAGASSTVKARLDALPKGRVGTPGTSTSDQTGIGASNTDLTSLSVTITAEAGRRYRISAKAFLQQKTSAGLASVVVTDGSNNIVDYVADITLAANDYFLATGWVEHSPGAGSITYKLRARTNAGTVDILNSQLTGRILVEDIGT